MNGKTLILKTANDNVMFKILDYYKDRPDVYCLIQSSGFDCYCNKYPHIQFCNMGGESFDNIDSVIKRCVGDKEFESVILPSVKVLFQGFSGIFKALERVKYKTLIFINVDGEVRLAKKSVIRDRIYNIILKFFSIYVGLWGK